MITSDRFYAAFDAGLDQAGLPANFRRRRGKPSRYDCTLPAATLAFWFQVNGKASAIPHQPGEFRPVITVPELCSDADDATVSWYQYADEAMVAAFLAQQGRVRENVAAQTTFELDIWRVQRDVSLRTMQDFMDLGLRPAWPHTGLYYLDESDAQAWGVLIGTQLPAWLAHFAHQPETLDAHMRRVHWGGETA